MSKKYPYDYGAKLIAFINGKQIEPNDNDTLFFKKYMELYDAVFDQEQASKDISVKEIKYKNAVVGWFAYQKGGIEVFKEKKDINRYVLAIDQQDRNSFSSFNTPIISLCRKPGMIVSYILNNQPVSGITLSENEYLLGIFVLNSNQKLSDKNKYTIGLDEYIRGSEKADHSTWGDHQVEGMERKLLVVRKIFTEIHSCLEKITGNQNEVVTEATLDRRLSQKFAKFFMPKDGFGTEGSQKIRESSKPRSEGMRSKKILIKQNKNLKLTAHSICFDNENPSIIHLTYELDIRNFYSQILVQTKINTNSKEYTALKWEEEGMIFPCTIEKLYINILEVNKKGYTSIIPISSCKGKISCDVFEIQFLCLPNEKCYGFSIMPIMQCESITISLGISIQTIDRHIQTFLDFESKEER